MYPTQHVYRFSEAPDGSLKVARDARPLKNITSMSGLVSVEDSAPASTVTSDLGPATAPSSVPVGALQVLRSCDLGHFNVRDLTIQDTLPYLTEACLNAAATAILPSRINPHYYRLGTIEQLEPKPAEGYLPFLMFPALVEVNSFTGNTALRVFHKTDRGRLIADMTPDTDSNATASSSDQPRLYLNMVHMEAINWYVARVHSFDRVNGVVTLELSIVGRIDAQSPIRGVTVPHVPITATDGVIYKITYPEDFVLLPGPVLAKFVTKIARSTDEKKRSGCEEGSRAKRDRAKGNG